MPGRMESRDLGSEGAGGRGRGAAGIRRLLSIISKAANLHQFFTISLHVIHKGAVEYLLILNLKKLMEIT